MYNMRKLFYIFETYRVIDLKTGGIKIVKEQKAKWYKIRSRYSVKSTIELYLGL